MINDLEQFSVERLEGLIGDAETWSSVSIPSNRLAALARIALAAKSASSPVIPDGWKLVPIEPSLKMMEAAVTCEDASFDTESDMVCIHHEVIYKAMLSAAPTPEEL